MYIYTYIYIYPMYMYIYTYIYTLYIYVYIYTLYIYISCLCVRYVPSNNIFYNFPYLIIFHQVRSRTQLFSSMNT